MSGGRQKPSPPQPFTPSCPCLALSICFSCLNTGLNTDCSTYSCKLTAQHPPPEQEQTTASRCCRLCAGWEAEALQANLLCHQSGTSRALLTRRAAESSQLWRCFTIRSCHGDRGARASVSCRGGGDGTCQGDDGLAPACLVSFWK